MTLIKPAKPVTRETATIYRGRPLIVELHQGYLTLRPKGTRQHVAVDYRAVLDLGYKLLAREKIAPLRRKTK